MELQATSDNTTVLTPLVATQTLATRLKNKFNFNWRTIPAIIAIVACIIGLVIATFTRYPYVSLIFAAGTIASSYFLFLAYDYKQMKSLKETSEDLQKTKEAIAQENNTLKQLVIDFTNKIRELGTKTDETNEKFEKTRTKFESTNDSLNATAEQLGAALTKGVSNITQKMDNYDQSIKHNLQQIQAMHSLLQSMLQEKSVIVDVESKISEFFSHNQDISESVSSVNTGVKENLALIKQLLSNELEKYRKIDETIDGKIKKNQELELQVARLEGILITLEEQKQQREAELQKIRAITNDLGAHVTTLKNTTKVASTGTGSLETNAANTLSNEVKHIQTGTKV